MFSYKPFFTTINYFWRSYTTFDGFRRLYTAFGVYILLSTAICYFRRLYTTFSFRDDTHMTSLKIVQYSRPPTPLVHLRPKLFHPLDLGRPISDEPPLPQMTTNQLKENIIQGWLLHVIRSFLQVGFRFFFYQLINLVWLSFDFFSFNWSLINISPSSWLYSLVCAVIQRYQEMSFICNYSHF